MPIKLSIIFFHYVKTFPNYIILFMFPSKADKVDK